MKAAVRIGKGSEHEMAGLWAVQPFWRGVATGFAGSEEAVRLQTVCERRQTAEVVSLSDEGKEG